MLAHYKPIGAECNFLTIGSVHFRLNVCGGIFVFYFNFDRKFCKQTVDTFKNI